MHPFYPLQYVINLLFNERNVSQNSRRRNLQPQASQVCYGDYPKVKFCTLSTSITIKERALYWQILIVITIIEKFSLHYSFCLLIRLTVKLEQSVNKICGSELCYIIVWLCVCCKHIDVLTGWRVIDLYILFVVCFILLKFVNGPDSSRSPTIMVVLCRYASSTIY